MKKLLLTFALFASTKLTAQMEILKLGMSRETFLYSIGTSDYYTYHKRTDEDFFYLNQYLYTTSSDDAVMFKLDNNEVVEVLGIYDRASAEENLKYWNFHELITSAGDKFWFNDVYICQCFAADKKTDITISCILNPKD